MKGVVMVLAVCALPFALIVGLAMVSASQSPALADPSGVCVTTGSIKHLDAAASANARIITAVAERLAGAAGAIVAVTTAITESGLHVLGNPSVATWGLPTEGVGVNLDSVGLFQQRASWGSVAARLDPAMSTELFIARLLTNPTWRSQQPWVAAQSVQVSAWDGKPRVANHYSSTYGGNYEANVPLATQVVDDIDRGHSAQECGALSGGMPANKAPGSHGLPGAYRIPASATPAESRVVAYAIAQLDKPYVYGAAGPNGFDCSGLTMAAWRSVGIGLPHQAAAQAQSGTPTSADALVAGDLVLVAGDDGTLAAPGHVGIYLGSGLVINAADQRDGIRVQTYDNFVSVGHGLAALRHVG